jgi:hypothetical protein
MMQLHAASTAGEDKLPCKWPTWGKLHVDSLFAVERHARTVHGCMTCCRAVHGAA